MDQSGPVEPAHVLADDRVRGLGVRDVDLVQPARPVVGMPDELHDEDVPLDRDRLGDADASGPGALKIRELLFCPRQDDRFLVVRDPLEPWVPLEVVAHLSEVRGVDPVHLHRHLTGILVGSRL